MNGPEHYDAAEAALVAMTDRPQAERRALMATAGVHALLAIAAAVGLNDTVTGLPLPDRDAWQAVAGLHPAPRPQPEGGEPR
ncbi:MAG TPA: hypothetical protein VF444_23445 [Pseudonocardiaceae bacterium]